MVGVIQKIKEFETISGVSVLAPEGGVRWEYKEIGAAVNMVMQSKYLNIEQSLKNFQDHLTRMLILTNGALSVKETK